MRQILSDLLGVMRGLGIGGMKSLALSIVRSASFSQYAEDIFVSRLLPLGKRGYFVDVGAAYPILNSNTYRFYLKGWSGLTIEPNPRLVAQHRIVRPRDTCVPVGVASASGTLVYHRFLPADYNTFDPEVAEELRARGIKTEASIEIPTRPLSAILDEHVGDRAIDLMSIDCEGLDLIVAQSADWVRHRPRVLMIEDHQPTLSEAVQSPIANYLRGQRYELVARLSYTSILVADEVYETLPSRAAARAASRRKEGLHDRE